MLRPRQGRGEAGSRPLRDGEPGGTEQRRLPRHRPPHRLAELLRGKVRPGQVADRDRLPGPDGAVVAGRDHDARLDVASSHLGEQRRAAGHRDEDDVRGPLQLAHQRRAERAGIRVDHAQAGAGRAAECRPEHQDQQHREDEHEEDVRPRPEHPVQVAGRDPYRFHPLHLRQVP
jgi:hypothetical protein